MTASAATTANEGIGVLRSVGVLAGCVVAAIGGDSACGETVSLRRARESGIAAGSGLFVRSAASARKAGALGIDGSMDNNMRRVNFNLTAVWFIGVKEKDFDLGAFRNFKMIDIRVSPPDDIAIIEIQILPVVVSRRPDGSPSQAG